jgi:IS6 family transposase
VAWKWTRQRLCAGYIGLRLSWKSGCAGIKAIERRVFRAVDKHCRLIDFMLADRRNTRAAYRFLGKTLTTMRHLPPSSITTDQLGSYPKAIGRLQREGKLSVDVTHRICKYLNNIIEADHGALKRVIRPHEASRP